MQGDFGSGPGHALADTATYKGHLWAAARPTHKVTGPKLFTLSLLQVSERTACKVISDLGRKHNLRKAIAVYAWLRTHVRPPPYR